MIKEGIRNSILLAGLSMFLRSASTAEEPSVAIPDSVAQGETGLRLREYCRRLSALDFNGSVLVAKGGEVIFHDAYGVADPRHGTLNTTHTAFSTGSVTKQFTAAAVLELEAKKKLSVIDPISRYLGPAPEDKQEITIHHLLTHSSGLPPSLGPDEEAISRDSLVALAMATPLLFKPGTAYEYSNVGYSLAAAIVEKVSGMAYEEFLQGLWQRAGLTETGLFTRKFPDRLVARSHNEVLGYPSQTDLPADAWHLVGNGGILSTPSDLYRWYTWLQSDNAISAAAREKMFTPHVREGEMESYYGYGWVIQESQARGGRVIWHNGGAMPHGWSCALYHYVNDSLVVIVFANKTIQGQQPMDHIAMGLVRLAFDPAAPMPPLFSDSVKVDSVALTGTYVLKDSSTLEIALVDGHLRVVPRGQANVTAVFPGPFPEDLTVYNRQTEALIQAAGRGEFDAAGKWMDMPPGRSGADFVREWWSRFTAYGGLKSVDIFGTRPGDGAETHARLNFEKGSAEASFFWQQGRCGGIGPGDRFYLEMLPQSSDAFASFNLATGQVIVAEFAGRRIMLDTGGGTVKATKSE